MRFRQAVAATPSVQGHYHSGLRALPAGDAARIRCPNPRRLTGSVNVDRALQPTQPSAPRWDYGIGFRRGSKEIAVWVEVHPASSTSIAEMLRKLEWLRNWLDTEALELKKLTEGDYHWISTDATIAITPNSPQAKKLAGLGLRGPKRGLELT
jgi:hypothetical protein